MPSLDRYYNSYRCHVGTARHAENPKTFIFSHNSGTQRNVQKELHWVTFEIEVVILNKFSLSVHSTVLMRVWLILLTTHASRLHYTQKEKIYLE